MQVRKAYDFEREPVSAIGWWFFSSELDSAFLGVCRHGAGSFTDKQPRPHGIPLPGLPPGTGTGTLKLFLSDVNDNAPTLQPRSRYMEVCESAVTQPLLIEAEDADLEPYSEPFTFKLDTTGENAQDTWQLGENQGECLYWPWIKD